MQGAMQGRAAQVLRPQCAASAASRRAGARCLGLSELRPAPALAHPAALHRLSPLSRRHTTASRQRRGEFRRLIYFWGACAAPRDAGASRLPCRRSRPRRMCRPLRSPSVRGGRAAPVERRRRSSGPGGRARPCCGPAQPLHFRLRLKRAAGRALAGSRKLRSVRIPEFQGEASGQFFGSGGQYSDSRNQIWQDRLLWRWVRGQGLPSWGGCVQYVTHGLPGARWLQHNGQHYRHPGSPRS